MLKIILRKNVIGLFKRIIWVVFIYFNKIVSIRHEIEVINVQK